MLSMHGLRCFSVALVELVRPTEHRGRPSLGARFSSCGVLALWHVLLVNAENNKNVQGCLALFFLFRTPSPV